VDPAALNTQCENSNLRWSLKISFIMFDRFSQGSYEENNNNSFNMRLLSHHIINYLCHCYYVNTALSVTLMIYFSEKYHSFQFSLLSLL
jgi:hypothetical protein